MNKKWEYYEKDEDEVKKIQDEFQISRLLANILVNKGLKEKKEIEVFLNPTRKVIMM